MERYGGRDSVHKKPATKEKDILHDSAYTSFFWLA